MDTQPGVIRLTLHSSRFSLTPQKLPSFWKRWQIKGTVLGDILRQLFHRTSSPMSHRHVQQRFQILSNIHEVIRVNNWISLLLPSPLSPCLLSPFKKIPKFVFKFLNHLSLYSWETYCWSWECFFKACCLLLWLNDSPADYGYDHFHEDSQALKLLLGMFTGTSRSCLIKNNFTVN
jgi:hypothetical protein